VLIVLYPSSSGVWAGSREVERAREESQRAAERAREQAQEAAERSREQAQEAAERSREQARQSTELERADRSREGTATSRREQESGEERRGSREREGRSSRSREQEDDDGPPKTVLEMIRRMSGATRKGPIGHLDRAGELASPEVLAVGLSRAGVARARGLGFNIRPSPHSRVMRMFPPPGLDAAAARDLLRADMPGDRFGLNHAYRPYRSATGENGDPTARARAVRNASIGGCDSARCYGPGVIGWQPELRTCAKNIRIGVIDTSIDRDHPAFNGLHVEVGNFLPSGASRTVNWHGTGVLAILAGNLNSGTPGLVPDAHFFAADVYQTDASGQPVADTASLLRAVEWMGESKVDVINMSMSGPRDELLDRAIGELSARGVVFVAAAGNGGPNAPPSYPAAYANVIAVTAVDKDLHSYVHASHGGYIDIAAPGVGIWTAVPNALEGFQSGTSFAAPYVTAIVAAVLKDLQGKAKQEVLRALTIRDLGQAGRDPVYGHGLAVAPTGCSPQGVASGWITSVVHTPALPSTVPASGVTVRPAGRR
jgi:hypothetical protein